MGRLRYARAAGAVTMVVTLGAAGCAGEPEPRFAPSEEPSPSASEAASPSASPSASPKSEAPEPLDREETVRAWVEARNDALQDGDTSGMSGLSTKACRGCAPFEENIEQVYESGGYFDTPGWAVMKTLPGGKNTIDLRVRTAPGMTVNADGEEPVAYEAAIRELRFLLEQEGERWLIDGVAVFEG